MEFSEAMAQVKLGHSIRRTAWEDGFAAFKVVGDRLCVKTVKDNEWHPLQGLLKVDIDAEDWVVSASETQ